MRWAESWSLIFGATALIFLALVSSFTATPLYPVYQEIWGMTSAGVSIAFSLYALGVIVVVLLFGGLSDRWGRRPTLLLAASAMALGLTVMAVAAGPGMLFVGRFLQGVATGFATGVTAATLMEEHPAGMRSGTVLNSVSLSLGSALGPYLAGFVAVRSAYPLAAPYVVILVLLVIPVTLLLMPTSRRPRPSGAVSVMRLVRIPPGTTWVFAIAAGGIAITNVTLAVFGAFGGAIASSVGWAGEQNAGRLVSTLLVTMALSQFAARKVSSTTTILLLAGVLAITGWILVWCAAALGAGYLMFAGIIACGGSAGLALLGASGLVGEMSPERNRAETYSALLVVAFSVLGATALLSGWVLTWAPLIDVIAACALLNIAICVPVMQGSVKLARTRSHARKTMNAIEGKHP